MTLRPAAVFFSYILFQKKQNTIFASVLLLANKLVYRDAIFHLKYSLKILNQSQLLIMSSNRSMMSY